MTLTTATNNCKYHAKVDYLLKKALDYTQKIIFHAISPLKALRGIWPLQKELSTIKDLFSKMCSITGAISLTHIKINRFSTFR
jgi:hypothetical protein